MTAEVAVLNRSAVALAADSAVTLSGRGNGSSVAKIFQNENKLFELSTTYPVALMLYNATNFFEIPWEIIIKSYRAEVGSKAQPHLFYWWESFLEFLLGHEKFCPNDDMQKGFFKQIVTDEFNMVLEKFINDSRPLLLEGRTRNASKKIALLFTAAVNNRLEYHKKLSFYSGMDELISKSVVETYSEELDIAHNAVFDSAPLSSEDKASLTELASAVVGRCNPSWFTSGLVFAGFGEGEIFPSLRSVEVGGMLNGRLRWISRRKVDISRNSPTASIIPFAQRDTIDALLSGSSRRYQASVVEHFKEAMMQVGLNVVAELTRPGAKRRDYENRVKIAVDGVISNFLVDRSPKLQKLFSADTLDVVRHMPKPDLAAFAESLVTVSSMMRKVTVGPETVGGPIDVAVISRHEGFVWVKRKHYFDAEQNRRYLWRAFQQAS